MFVAMAILFVSLFKFIEGNPIDSITLKQVLAIVAYMTTLPLFWIGDLAIFNISRVLRRITPKGSELSLAARRHVVKDVVLVSLHIVLLILMAYMAVFATAFYPFASMILAGLNGVWLISKIFQFNFAILKSTRVFSAKISKCRDAMLMWIAINSVYSAIMSGILSKSPPAESIFFASLALTILRSLLDFVLCRDYYVDVIDAEYSEETLTNDVSPTQKLEKTA